MPDELNNPSLDDVMDAHEPATPHRREHAKASRRPDELELESKVEVEWNEVGSDGGVSKKEER